MEEWWSRSSRKFSKVYRCEVSFLFFFFERRSFVWEKRFRYWKGALLSLSLFQIFLSN